MLRVRRITTWKNLAVALVLFGGISALFGWSILADDELELPFKLLAASPFLGLILILGGALFMSYRYRVISLAQVDPDAVTETVEKTIIRYGFQWEEKSSSAAKPGHWFNPTLRPGPNDTVRIVRLAPTGPELWCVFSNAGSFGGSAATLSVRGEGDKKKVDPIMKHLIYALGD